MKSNTRTQHYNRSGANCADTDNDQSYVPRRIKRKRRSKTEVEAIKETMFAIVRDERPMTVRQVFYRMTTTGLIGKTENEYKSTIGRLLRDMRVAGEIPYNWITDSTRYYRGSETYGSLAEAVKATAQHYRRDLWSYQDTYVEVWIEKDTLSGVITPVTEKWGVPLFVCRGYSSLTGAYEVAQNLLDNNKPTVIYNVGDDDPSGVDAWRDVREKVASHLPANFDIKFERLAVTPEQVDRWKLPSRPTKTTDSRSAKFGRESTEVEAIPPDKLRTIVDTSIEQWVDPKALDAIQTAEASERAYLNKMVSVLGGAA